MVCHKEEECLISFTGTRGTGGILLVIGVDRHAGEPEHGGEDHAGESGDEFSFETLFPVFGREVTLDGDLVAAGVGQRSDNGIPDHQEEEQPDIGRERIEIRFGKLRYAVTVGNGASDRFHDAAVDFVADYDYQQHETADQHEELQHIGPDDRFGSAFDGVDHADHAHQQNGEPR